MKSYRHKRFPNLTAEIQYEWHREYRNDCYMLLDTDTRIVIMSHVLNSEIENNPNWELVYDSEEESEESVEEIIDRLEVASLGSTDIEDWKKLREKLDI